MDFKEQPISNVKWIDAKSINPNKYNPNIVGRVEMNGLKNSILNNGWIFPITINKEGYIIDGYHRYWLSLNDKDFLERFKGKIPVCEMSIPVKDAMCMTVTMNSAKGVHQASLVSKLVIELHKEHNMTINEIATKCTMSKEEVEFLIEEDVFSSLDIKNHKYSMAWVPEGATE